MQTEEVVVVETVRRVYRAQVPARVGLLGNPSDGFKGKTLSLLIKNFCATVELIVNTGTHLLTHLLTHSPTHSPTHSLTHSQMLPIIPSKLCLTRGSIAINITVTE
jgi:hypothetical protein